VTLCVYELADGTFVTEAIEKYDLFNTPDVHDGRHCESEHEVVEFFDSARWSSNMVLEVLEDAGIQISRDLAA